MATSMRMRPPTSGRISCAIGLDLGADIEDLRLQRLPPREGQQLAGQLRGAFHGVRDGVDVAAAALFRQFAAAQEVGRRADDGQEVVEVVRDAAGQLADGFHLLRLAQRFLALAALGDVDRFRHRADDGAVLVAQRPHGEVEIAIADRQHAAASRSSPPAPRMTAAKGVAHGFAHAVGRGEPRRFPERLCDDVGDVGARSRPAPSRWRRARCRSRRAGPDTGGWSRRSRASALRWIRAARCAARCAAPASRSSAAARSRPAWPR